MSIDKLKSKFSNGTFVRDVKHFFEKINEIIDYLNGTSGEGSYKVYTALLTQTGTDAPVATILKNTLDGIPLIEYVGAGEYSLTLNNAFILNKVFLPESGFIAGTDLSKGIDFQRINSNVIYVQTYDVSTVTKADEILYNTPIEIRVYN